MALSKPGEAMHYDPKIGQMIKVFRFKLKPDELKEEIEKRKER
jgi:hypothetical protein